MNDETRLRIRHAFDRLSEGGRALTDIDRALMEAFERLMHGLPELTDGKITVVNVCTEAGVSRASYYRSPVAQAVTEILEAPQTRRPEPEELRAEVSRLKKAERELRSEHAAEIRELKDTVATYANQIQVLTLRSAELEAHNARLIERLRQLGENVAALPAQSRPSL
ncbi:hypothetical protein OG585_51440 (plasmid) [Streptomyces sp. NBC_01340]|uniref:hypothetical protein n=1 Tax=unclassified Streptomyces TaxID=2593676 RepID=UPI0022508C22|nr:MULTISPECIES: hypothetical protein [unclassified Streptomyces]MCX4458620.1 hypothetical protein [Streptomyces sp. NBC_01719]MCX4460465.1 hypothetical protein [Streptomyces sp. NBC_01719]MCX4497977.1 hypothetical protein [Streptomyces sp. NBC_01728]MCX4500205.1 hypothetical protein [Streptomyces sp. NBC_01728]WSI45279.1 hypothetical protein OG585_51440 [Streptomyces sp. NBC_01340]